MPLKSLVHPFRVGVLVSAVVSSMLIAQPVPLSGIAHVALRVSDLEQTRAFYQKLGFQQAFEFSDAGRVTQSFIKIGDRQFIELYPRTQDDQIVGLMHVCYESTDISTLRELLAKRGAEPADVKKARAGNQLFVLHDPENKLVEYTQYLPGSLHSEDQGKHLGAKRVSEHLGKVAIPVTNVGTEQEFYSAKLGFLKMAGQVRSLGVPGSRDSIELRETDRHTIEMRFTVDDLKKAGRKLHDAGLKPEQWRGALAVTDPDGNRIVFERN